MIKASARRVHVLVAIGTRDDALLEGAVSRISLRTGVTAVAWEVVLPEKVEDDLGPIALLVLEPAFTTMTKDELLEEVHWAKLSTDVGSSVVSLTLIWRGRGAGLLVHYMPPVVASAALLRSRCCCS
jgi:hypothetical protein